MFFQEGTTRIFGGTLSLNKGWKLIQLKLNAQNNGLYLVPSSPYEGFWDF